MWAAAKGQWEVCVKLVELGADLNQAQAVSEICSSCVSVCRYIIVMLTFFFFELAPDDGLGVCCL